MQPVGSVSQCANAALNAAWLFVASPLFPPNEVSNSLGRCLVAEAASVSTVLLVLVLLVVLLPCIAAATLCSVALSAALTVAGAQRLASAGLWSNSCAKITSALLRNSCLKRSFFQMLSYRVCPEPVVVNWFFTGGKRAMSYLTDKTLEATGARRAPCHR